MTNLSDFPLRDDLVGKKPYGAPQSTTAITLNVNETNYEVPDEVVQDILLQLKDEIKHANRYPDREFTKLRHAIAEFVGYGLRPENIWAANGSNEVLQQILQAFGGPGRSVLSFSPTYSMYPLLAEGTGTAWLSVPRASDFTLNAGMVTEAIKKHQPSVTIICSPNNPTGTPVTPEVITAAYEATEGVLVIDEAYVDFADSNYTSAVELLEGRPRMLVSRTMSKAFAFAGVRLGYLIAHPVAIDALRLVRLPYHLSALTQSAATTALKHSSTMMKMVSKIVSERKYLAQKIAELGYSVTPSESNFILFGKVADPNALFEAIYDRGILVRNVGVANHLRVSVGTEQENRKFIRVLTEVTQNLGIQAE